MNQYITDSIPKSTIAVAMLLWTVLFALMAWTLVETVQNGRLQSAQLQQADSIKREVDDHESRIRVLERIPRDTVRR